uniref:Elastase 2 like n=1 Tax=Xiphophorus maculatus TaxID=8083 RepID=A0A3B5PYN9_XIPMA
VIPVFLASLIEIDVPTVQPVVNQMVNGVDVRPHSCNTNQTMKLPYLFQVSLHCKIDGEWQHSCGEVLGFNWISVASDEPTCSEHMECRVALGKHTLNQIDSGSAFMGSANIVMHEEWDILTLQNDTALIKLSSPFALSDTITPACLPDRDVVLPHGTPCLVTGWGRLSTNGPAADILQQAFLPVVGHDVCSQPDWWNVLATEKMVCAGGDGITAGCNRDSGGLLNCPNPDGSWDVHGIVSFGSGEGCNVLQKPTVFTQVRLYV